MGRVITFYCRCNRFVDCINLFLKLINSFGRNLIASLKSVHLPVCLPRMCSDWPILANAS